MTDFANGKTRRSVAKVLLRAIGMPEPDIETMLRDAMDGQIDSLPPENMTEAEKKTLNRPFRTPGGPKKFGVYIKNAKGNVIKLPFGDPKMKIKRDDPGRRRGFRARHNCHDPGPKWKARYWSCRFWSKPSVTKLLKESFQTGEVPWDGRTFVRESWLLKTNPRLLEVRCPTGKGGGIDNSCKRKNKKAAATKKKHGPYESSFAADFDEEQGQFVVDEQGMFDFGLDHVSEASNDDAAAVTSYQAEFFYPEFNGHFRMAAIMGDDVNDHLDAKQKNVHAVLKKLGEKHRLKSDVMLFRGIGADDEGVIESLKPGDFMMDHAYQSTSLNPLVAANFADANGPSATMLRIHAKKGNRAIPADAITYRAGSGDSPDSDQAARAGMSVLSEFILPSETGFKVLSNERDKNGLRILDVEISEG